MRTKLPLIVGFGGFNAAGRSSGHRAYERMIYESLNPAQKNTVISSLSAIMGLKSGDEKGVLDGTLVRKLDSRYIDPDAANIALNVKIDNRGRHPVEFELTARQMPASVPSDWDVVPMDEEGRRYRICVANGVDARINIQDALQVKAAGQLPSGFDPSGYYRSLHHPRGLQMSVLGASDAVNSLGIDWQTVCDAIDPDQMSVYSSSVMAQLDANGLGGMLNSRALGQRPTSKQLSMGFTSMPADFTNAYVLGGLGATGAVTGACATFLYNLRWAVEDIRRGRRKVAVVGCSEAPILPEVIDGFAAMSALATDDNLCQLDGVSEPDYRRASRPFGQNCGFTLAESVQYIILMSDDLAVELGANIYGAVPGVYVNADGYKKSISAPGAGNYLTMAKAVGLARTLLGEKAVQHQSFIQAHGSSTPQNRTTESKIFDQVAQAFGVESWPVCAVKSYLGHSLGPASGDQLACSLGIFDRGIVPGIKTIDGVADDVYADKLSICSEDYLMGADNAKIAFLNSKGFGGNNATATLFSPSVARDFLTHHYASDTLNAYQRKREAVCANSDEYVAQADAGDLKPRYYFGTHLIDERKIELNADSIRFPGYSKPVSLIDSEGLSGFNVNE